MKMIKLKPKLAAMLSIGVFAGGLTVSAAAAAFRDVPADFWGQAHIQWAIDQKIVDGYPDGTFRPNSAISRDEFVSMLIRAYKPVDLKGSSANGSWADPYWAYAAEMDWKPDNGDSLAFTRGEAAQYLVNATGKKFNVEDSVQYLLDLGLSDGKNGKHLSGYEKDGKLTRAEAVAFIERFQLRYSTLHASPGPESKYNRTVDFEVYENKYFTILLPKSWNQQYEVTVHRNQDQTETYDFIHTPNKAFGGNLFAITVWPVEEWSIQEEDVVKAMRVEKIGEMGNRIFTIRTASDVQYNVEDIHLKSEYLSLAKDIIAMNYSVYFQSP